MIEGHKYNMLLYVATRCYIHDWILLCKKGTSWHIYNIIKNASQLKCVVLPLYLFIRAPGRKQVQGGHIEIFKYREGAELYYLNALFEDNFEDNLEEAKAFSGGQNAPFASLEKSLKAISLLNSLRMCTIMFTSVLVSWHYSKSVNYISVFYSNEYYMVCLKLQ